ncbi:MAG: tyrosine recombinase XerC [Chloroflexi bacterium]|nr:tyrosine recombinase XerC [Chloroflexota bacterium]
MQQIFDRYIQHLEAERNLSPKTVRNYANDLLGNYARGPEKGFFQFLVLRKITSLDKIDRKAVRDYMAYLMEQGIVKPSIARKLSAIRSFYHYLRQEEIVTAEQVPINLPRRRGERSSSFSLKLDKRIPTFLTIQEMERLLGAPDLSTPLGQRDRAFLELLYASGLRVSELVGLDVDQLNLDDGEIHVWGKGSKERAVLMGKPAAEALNAYIRHGRNELLSRKSRNALFLNRYGGRLTERTVQKLLNKYARSIGIQKKVHPHTLRHTFATHMLDGGADLRVVQELLGHADLSSTQIYTQVTKSQAKKVYMSAHPMAQQKGNDDNGAGAPAVVRK